MAGKADISRLEAIMAQLRDPDGGCPWDLEQTHQTLRSYLLEEAYEALEAIDSEEPPFLCEELGDVLLQVVFHAQIAREANAFSLQDVIDGIADKMVRRHPHIFGDEKAPDADRVRDRWSEIKAAEGKSFFGGLPKPMPALLRAQRVGEKAAQEGFDWPDLSGVFQKVDEELRELSEASGDPGHLLDTPSRKHADVGADQRNPRQTSVSTAAGTPDEIEDELGDLLLATANLARHLGVDAESALRRATAKFERRYLSLREGVVSAGSRVNELHIDELEARWQAVKAAEKVGQTSGDT